MSYLDNIRTFVRVYELGSMSAAGRDMRISPAVTSARISLHLTRSGKTPTAPNFWPLRQTGSPHAVGELLILM